MGAVPDGNVGDHDRVVVYPEVHPATWSPRVYWALKIGTALGAVLSRGQFLGAERTPSTRHSLEREIFTIDRTSASVFEVCSPERPLGSEIYPTCLSSKSSSSH
jgi:hypothetical protein